MKKLLISFASLLSVSALFAQPILNSANLQTGLSFNLYSIGNLTIANLTVSGANATWDLSSASATLAGTAELLDMASTPYAVQYPNANFAIKFTPTGQSAQYSLFNLSSTIFEEVANNVGTASATSFTNARTSLAFPFTFGLTDTDTYQKSTQNQKSISHTYDAFGTFIANNVTYTNVIRDSINDDGNTSFAWWNSAPISPLFQASSSGFILWQNATPSAVNDINSNLLFDVYPNPASNQLTIINKELISKIEIINAIGQLLFVTTKSNIDISSLKPGVYFIKAYSTKGTMIHKFVKE